MKNIIISLIISILFWNNVMAQCNPSAGIDASACGQSIILQGTLSQPGSAALWSTSYPGVIFTDPTQPTTTAFIPAYSGSWISVTFVFTETNTGIPCTVSDTVVITFFKFPHAEAGVNLAVCGTTALLYADTVGSGIVNGYWTSSVPGISITPTGTPPFPGATIDASSLLPGFWINSTNSAYFYWVAQNGPGCVSVDSVRIDFYEIPTAHLGPDTSVCGKMITMTNGWSIDNPSGIWTILPTPPPPGSANFIPNNQPNTTATVSAYGDYSFIWKEMNAGNSTCLDRDTITVHFLTVPTPDAGLDFTVCGSYAHIQATPTVPGGYWLGPSPLGYYDGIGGNYNLNYKDSASSYIGWFSVNDTITMYWYEFNGLCYGYDSVNVYFASIEPAISLVDPADSITCGPTFSLLNAQQPAYGYGFWLDTVLGTTFSPLPTYPNPTATIDTGVVNYYGYHNFYWITLNGICRDTSAVVRIKFIEKPIANAGGHYWPGIFGLSSHIKTDTVCGLNYQMGAIPSTGTGIWYTQFLSSVFAETGSITSHTYNDSLSFNCPGCYSVFNGTWPKYYEYTWMEVNQICTISDTLRLYFAPVPSGNFTVTPPVCPQNNFEIIAHTWPLPNDIDYGVNYYNWSFPEGILDPVISSPSASDTILVSWSTGNVHNVTLSTSNVWGCSSQTVSQVLTEPPSGIVHGHLTSSPVIDYSAFEIKAYREEANTEAPLVETIPLTSSGNYTFGVSGAGNFYLQAKLINPAANIPFANTYYTNAFEWANAQTITMHCLDTINANIPLLGFTPAIGGQCRIYGLVRYDGTLDPVQNATVYMRYQPNQDPARFELTHANGYYCINNIPTGNYKLFVDMPGLPQVTNHHIVVNPNDTVFANVNFIVDTSNIHKQYGFGIYADTTGFINVPLNDADNLTLSVYPIPFNHQLNISATLPTSEIISAELYDNLGKLMVCRPEQKYESGEMNFSLPASQLPSGIYFLKITVGNSVYIKKVTK